MTVDYVLYVEGLSFSGGEHEAVFLPRAARPQRGLSGIRPFLLADVWFYSCRRGHNSLDERLALVQSYRKQGKGPYEMDFGVHPTVEAVHETVRAKGGSLSCPVCGRAEFALEEVTVLGGGMMEGYGTRRLQRGQLVCENCGCVVVIDLARLRAGVGDDAGEPEG